MVNELKGRLAGLRSLMARKGTDALIVPSSDPHMGEYVPDHWRVIRWLTGFTGSAGTLVVTKSFAGLWTDSRYFLQAEEQLKGSGFELVRLKIPHTPEYIDWLAGRLKSGSRVTVDGRVISASQITMLLERFKEKGIKLSLKGDLITPLWSDRPLLPGDMAWQHPVEYAGEGRGDKIGRVRQKMKEMKADYQLLTSCDDIMWMLNIRGADITYSPLLLSFALVSDSQVVLFADEDKIPGVLKAEFDRDGIVLLPYDATGSVLGSLPEKSSVTLSLSTTSAALYRSIPRSCKIIADLSIPTRLKAIRNETEIKNLRCLRCL